MDPTRESQELYKYLKDLSCKVQLSYRRGNSGADQASQDKNYSDSMLLVYCKRRYRFIFDYKRIDDCDIILLEGQLDNYGRGNMAKFEDKKLALIYSDDDIIVNGIEKLQSRRFKVKSGSEMVKENLQPIKEFWKWLFD